MTDENRCLHVVVFPWLAFGHMLPYLELSKSLAEKGHRISFITTPRNLRRLPRPPSQISDLIHFVPLPLPQVDGLPTDAEATSDLPADRVEYLKLAFDRLERPFRQFIQQTSPKPDWIIQDFAHHWVRHTRLQASRARRFPVHFHDELPRFSSAAVEVGPVIPVGLLPPPEMKGSEGSEGADILGWLDKQKPRSAVYIAFGSEATLSPDMLHQLALGLEMSKLPFVWALKELANASADEPKFCRRAFEERGLRILAHESIGGFLTHSGWSSVIMSLQFGHPLVLLPIFSDQGINARVIMEKGVAVEIERDEEDGSFTKEAVARALRLVVTEEEGGSIRRRAEELREVFIDKDRQEKYVDDFVKYLQENREGGH
ncbi:UDP-glycosyltransferase 91A1-like [Asparagus officinalis]|uniref:UDP-glycosyltransferase 91A1-like n=1 Tax=Asparagus officinalis TaxID=4686 RepID=UPI00098E5695|nr:UDP-glycosyltransferase 91A1-like [Asparagus officinalis]